MANENKNQREFTIEPNPYAKGMVLKYKGRDVRISVDLSSRERWNVEQFINEALEE